MYVSNPVNNGRFSISTGEFYWISEASSSSTILPDMTSPLTLDGLVISTGLLPPGRLGSAPGDFLVSSKPPISAMDDFCCTFFGGGGNGLGKNTLLWSLFWFQPKKSNPSFFCRENLEGNPQIWIKQPKTQEQQS